VLRLTLASLFYPSKEMFYSSTVLCGLQITRNNYIILLEASISNCYIHLRGMSVLQNLLSDLYNPIH
jgi:hypothetical protein